MAESDNNEDKVVYNGRLFEAYQPLQGDLQRAAEIAPDACPRRYCWWWKNLSFEWELSAADGCTWKRYKKPSHWTFTDVPCCWCDTNSQIDHFEPREPHIEVDGIDAKRWFLFRDENHRRFPA